MPDTVKQRVLIADDEPSMRTTLADILQESGFDVAVAVDGESAVAMCEQQLYDVVLLDVRMPGMGGVLLTKPGLVFVGAVAEHRFRALDLETAVPVRQLSRDRWRARRGYRQSRTRQRLQTGAGLHPCLGPGLPRPAPDHAEFFL